MALRMPNQINEAENSQRNKVPATTQIHRTQASLKVARRSVRANITNIKNFGRPILGSGPVLRSQLWSVEISQLPALVYHSCEDHVLLVSLVKPRRPLAC